jgi:hypothetical protein
VVVICKVEANERAGKEFPLQGRCLANSDWRQADTLESLLAAPYETSQAMQAHEGMGLGEVYLMMRMLYNMVTAAEVQVTLLYDWALGV